MMVAYKKKKKGERGKRNFLVKQKQVAEDGNGIECGFEVVDFDPQLF